MSADLHIHIYEGLTKNDMEAFFSNVLGSKYCPLSPMFEKFEKEEEPTQEELSAAFEHTCRTHSHEDFTKLWEKFSHTPNVWVGSVSWLKAGLTGDSDTYIPQPVEVVSDIIGEDLPIIDDELIGKIRAALRLSNDTGYQVASEPSVVAFLERHRGKQVFTVSW